MAEQRPTPHEDYSGLQVVETGLEVAEPRQGLSQNRTWEQTSPLPEAIPQHQPQQQQEHDAYKNAPYPAAYTGGYGGSPDAAYSATISPDYGYQGGLPPEPPVLEKNQDRRICGLRRHVFWAVVAIAVFAIVAAIAIGVGVGIATRNNGSHDSSPSPSATTSVNATGTNTLPSPSATATGGLEVQVVCPTDNRTLYDISAPSQSGGNKKFLVLCGRDYSSAQGAVDLFTKNTTTFAECLDDCANQEGCTAVGWGNYYGTNTCWLKSSIGEPNWSSSWYAAVEDESS
ncbi:hypothetical protein NKR23_g2246 [Pleurostoma richardsiae]|uniref:Apple domain-containing protein n=1 Tax=Pleurostoma richardsiae TaxID=41990 RepID=A0AA38RXZ8_9PEZI|nr:hypothetical protein NKR23_g2246 [Pleurostoma richardsiae]